MEKTELLISKCTEFLKDRLENSIPTEGNFPRTSVSFKYPETSNEAILWIESSNNSRYLCVGMREAGCDKVAYHYYAKGTNGDLITCLSDSGITAEIHNDLRDLRETVDNFD